MDNSAKYTYAVQVPLLGHPDPWYTVARATTPEGAAEVVRVLLLHRDSLVAAVQVRVEVLA